jgi:hypothetical protein
MFICLSVVAIKEGGEKTITQTIADIEVIKTAVESRVVFARCTTASLGGGWPAERVSICSLTRVER